MGWHFEFKHTNFAGYLTAEKPRTAPRAERGVLWEFLGCLSDRHTVERAIVTRDPNWRDSLRNTAAQQLESVGRGDFDEVLNEDAVAKILYPLRKYFTGYQIYSLLIPAVDERYPDFFEQTFRQLALESNFNILVLLPSTLDSSANIVDPFPAISSLASQALTPPLAVFWTPEQSACALSINNTKDFIYKYIASGKYSLGEINNVIKIEAQRNKPKKVLHLSDFHFGDPVANRRKNYFKNHIAETATDVDRVVISGDLFDTPSADLRGVFDEFRNDLEQWTKKPPVLVPGNHDVRRKGNAFWWWGRNSEHAIDIGFDPVVVDDDLRAVFYCFNSCEVGDFAAGGVGDRQRLERASQFDRLKRAKPDLGSFVKIAVVHHHPYSYDTAPTATYEKIVRRLFGDTERFVAFENARDFVNWCGMRGVSLVLHGHKHVPHNVMASFEIRDQVKELMIVGCGSTTGVENKPMCYDIINLDPATGRWSVSFFHDPDGDGSGFTLQNVTLDLRSDLPDRC